MHPTRLLRALLLLASALALSSTGCSTALSTMQPVEPMAPGHVHASGGMTVNVPVSRIVSAVDATASMGEQFVRDTSYVPSEEDRRKTLAAATGLALASPGVNHDFMLRVGAFKNFDVGLRYSGLAAHIDGKYRFFGDEKGWQGAASLGISKALYSGFAFDALEFVKIDDFSRWNVELPILFGRRLDDFGHVWMGPKYVYSHYTVDAAFQSVGLVDSTSGSIHHLGAFCGAALGYKYVFAFAEMSAAWMFAEPTILGQKVDLGGLVVVPAGGLMLRI